MFKKQDPLTYHGEPIGRIKASWLLVKESFRFLRADAELVFVPVISGIILVILFAFLLIAVLATGLVNVISGETLWSTQAIVLLFGGYLVTTFAVTLTQAMVTHTVYIRAQSGNASLGESFKAALSHTPSLFFWSVIQSTVGVILRLIAERSERLGRIVSAMLGVGWTLITFFVVPAIMIDKKKAYHAITHSAQVFKSTWGEALVTSVSIGLIFLLAHVTMLIFLALAIVLGAQLDQPLVMILGVIVWVLWLFAAIAVEHVLRAIVRTLLYVYATTPHDATNFDAELLGLILGRGNRAVTSSPVPSPEAPAAETPTTPAV